MMRSMTYWNWRGRSQVWLILYCVQSTKSLNLPHQSCLSVVQGRLPSVLLKMASGAPVGCAAKIFARLMLPGTDGLAALQVGSGHAAMIGTTTTWSHQMISQTQLGRVQPIGSRPQAQSTLKADQAAGQAFLRIGQHPQHRQC